MALPVFFVFVSFPLEKTDSTERNINAIHNLRYIFYICVIEFSITVKQ